MDEFQVAPPTSDREGKGYCVKGGWREEGESVKCVFITVKERARRSVNPIPNPLADPARVCRANRDFKPEPS